MGLSSATRQYIGSAPKRVKQHYEEGGYGGERPGGQSRDAGYVAERGEVVDPRKAHDLPPGVLLASALLGLRSRHVLDHFRKQPALESAGRGLRRGFGFRHYARPPEAWRRRQGRLRQDPPSGTRLTSFFGACGVSCRVRAERAKPYASQGSLAGDSPRGRSRSLVGPRPPAPPGGSASSWHLIVTRRYTPRNDRCQGSSSTPALASIHPTAWKWAFSELYTQDTAYNAVSKPQGSLLGASTPGE